MNDELPEGWARAALDEVLQDGGLFDGPFGSNLKTSDYCEAGIRVIRLENLANLRFVGEKRTFISPEKYRALTKHTVAAGDILFGSFVDGDIRVCLLPELDTKAIAKADCFCIRPDDRAIDRKYLVYQLAQSRVRDQLLDDVHGATRPRITTRQLRQLEVLMCPLSEQRRIVAKLEELLGKVDACKQLLERVPELLKRFRHSVLAAACSGRLTEDWREQNPGAAAANDNIPDDAPDVPATWKWKQLSDIAHIRGGVTKGRKLIGAKRIFLPYLRVANVQDGRLDLAEIKRIEAVPEDLTKYRLEVGDVLFTEGGDRDKLGRGAVWQGQIPECIHQNHIFRARLITGEATPEYLSLATKSGYSRRYFFENASQTVNLASINLTILSALQLAIPPVEEQREIVRRVAGIFELSGRYEARVVDGQRQMEQIGPSLLATAFRGDLVPTEAELARREGRVFEPASVLLERIRAERARRSKEAAGRAAGSAKGEVGRAANSSRRSRNVTRG